jgi:hypothetical protein
MIHLTLDQDWAPDWATEDALDRISAAGAAATLFVTHASPGLERWRTRPGLELGVHPNFLPGSTHGATVDAVLDHVRGLVPDARGVRAHGLVRGTHLLEAYGRRGYAYDASDLIDGTPGLTVLPRWSGVARVPIFWEDDVHLHYGHPAAWEAVPPGTRGVRVFSFHPVLLALNAADLAGYRALKAELMRQKLSLPEAPARALAPFRHEGPDGLGAVFAGLLGHLASHPDERGGTLASLVSAEVRP